MCIYNQFNEFRSFLILIILYFFLKLRKFEFLAHDITAEYITNIVKKTINLILKYKKLF